MSTEQKESVLNLERLSFEEIKYSRNTNAGMSKVDYEANFSREVHGDGENNHFRVALTANLWSKGEEQIRLTVKLVGFFSCFVEEEQLKRTLVYNNAIAIMFPYLRSQISLITAQPDMPPITLPPMNIVAMFDEAEDQKE